ncbi:MAG: hypothetical protein OXG34_07020 [bacterium]|nr:hypothetical protein [bacterium]
MANLNQGDRPPSSVEAVVWDLDDTLVVERPAAEAAVAATCQQAAIVLGVDPNQLEQDVFDEAQSNGGACPPSSLARSASPNPTALPEGQYSVISTLHEVQQYLSTGPDRST